MMICPKCGKELSDGETICPSCEYLLDNTLPEPSDHVANAIFFTEDSEGAQIAEEITAVDAVEETALEVDAEAPVEEAAIEVSAEVPAEEAAVEVSTEVPAEEAAIEVSVEAPAEEAAVEVSAETPTEEAAVEVDAEAPTEEAAVEVDAEAPTEDIEPFVIDQSLNELIHEIQEIVNTAENMTDNEVKNSEATDETANKKVLAFFHKIGGWIKSHKLYAALTGLILLGVVGVVVSILIFLGGAGA